MVMELDRDIVLLNICEKTTSQSNLDHFGPLWKLKRQEIQQLTIFLAGLCFIIRRFGN